MAEILTLPVEICHAGAGRLAGALAQALDDGEDLGPRGPHIRALSLSLRTQL